MSFFMNIVCKHVSLKAESFLCLLHLQVLESNWHLLLKVKSTNCKGFAMPVKEFLRYSHSLTHIHVLLFEFLN